MGLESGTTIADLDKSNPLSSDDLSEGDNHLRLIKQVLKDQFPGEGLNGFAKPITVTEDEINTLAGSNTATTLQQQIDEIEGNDQLSAPPGTVMFFFNAAPPTGWLQQTDSNDSMLRFVNSGGGGFGGSDSPVNMDISHTHAVNGHALTVDEMPNHLHAMFVNNDNDVDVAADGYVAAFYDTGTTGANSYRMKKPAGAALPSLGKSGTAGGGTGAVSGDPGQAHDHGNTSSGGGIYTPRYLNVIRAVKV